MKETYILKDLLLFWQMQAKDNFAVIEALVNLIEYESENLSEENKKEVILSTLRKYGLYEIGYKGERNFQERSRKVDLKEDKPKTPESEMEWNNLEFIVPIDLYNIRLLNVAVEFESYLN